MNPVIKRRQKGKIRKLPFFSSRFNLLLIFCVDVEHSSRHNLAVETNPDNLALQEMGLFSFEVRVHADYFLEVS